MITPAALAQAIASLDRPEDRGLFSQDVLVTYPQLAAEYSAICPVRMDLATMQAKATGGKYHPAGTDINPSRASSRVRDVALQTLFDAVMADVRLMTGNCIKYNQLVPTLVEAAKSQSPSLRPHFAAPFDSCPLLRQQPFQPHPSQRAD